MSASHRRFDALVAALLPQLYRYAYWLAADRALAEDIVQEALIRAWKSLDSLQDERKAKSWLLTIVRREHARHYERKRLETVDIDTVEVAGYDDSPVETDAEIRDLRRLMAALEPEYREPLVMQVVLGCTCEEIAAALDLTRGAVLTRLFRARKQLTEKVAPAQQRAARGAT